jgi:two-component system C4-dicarboxylate transport response regulator DctD
VLDSLDEMPVSLVVSDVSMPEMSGFALTHLVHQRQPGLPVVLMTGGHFDPEIDPIATDFGAFALLHKPFDANLLWSTVEHALAQGQQTVQEHARQTPLTAARLRGSLP